MKQWVVVACRAEAKIFIRNSKAEELRWLKTLEKKKGRRRERDFNSDAPGMGSAKFSGFRSPHRLEGKSSHAEIVATHFAHTIAKFLKTAREEKRYEHVTVFAGPSFLGKVKAAVEAEMSEQIFTFIGKNLDHEDVAKIDAHLSP